MKLYCPPSLKPDVIDRSWLDSNGELGVRPEDVNAFLEACERDHIPVLGWEMWLIDNQWDGRDGAEPCSGQWTGLIPATKGGTCVWSGDGDVIATRRDIATLEWKAAVPVDLHPRIRLNFTLDV
jgi:hypothetical protein